MKSFSCSRGVSCTRSRIPPLRIGDFGWLRTRTAERVSDEEEKNAHTARRHAHKLPIAPGCVFGPLTRRLNLPLGCLDRWGRRLLTELRVLEKLPPGIRMGFRMGS